MDMNFTVLSNYFLSVGKERKSAEYRDISGCDFINTKLENHGDMVCMHEWNILSFAKIVVENVKGTQTRWIFLLSLKFKGNLCVQCKI